VVWAIMITNVPRFMRLVRAEALALREARFIEAAHAIGATRSRIAFRHILPNVTGVILVQVSLSAASALIVIAALAFIGIGAPPPEPSWGAMIRSGFSELPNGHWWISIFPGLAICFCVFWLNVVAETLEKRYEKF
jgi:peptide/nickel transport system permease protein